MIDLIDEYQKELALINGFAKSTVENYVSCANKFCEYVKNHLHISPVDVQGKHVCLWIYELKNSNTGYSRLDNHRSALQTFFAMLMKMKIVNRNPAEALPPLRKRQVSTVKPVSKQIVCKLLNVPDRSMWYGLRNYMMISMLWALGLRVNELTSLRVGSFEHDYNAKQKIGLLRVKGKNRKERALFVVDRLYDNLMAYLSHPQSLKKKRDPLFPVKTGNAISPNNVQRKIREYCQLAGITERITPHVLRHCFATDMYHENVPLNAIQAMMGHNNIAETAVYIKVSDQLKQGALLELSISERKSWE